MADPQNYTLIPQSSVQQVLELNRVVKTCQSEMALAEASGDDVVKAMVAAGAMNQLRGLIEKVMPDIRQLVGSPLGISCEQGAQWPDKVVGDVVLQGVLQGGRIVGGEIHIASGRCYMTKAYWERRFKEFPGVTNVQPPAMGLPRYQVLCERNYATVQTKLVYRLDGKLQTLDRTGDAAITVVVNKGMGLDAIYGKVKKRLYQTAYAVVSGQHVVDDEEATVEGTIVEPGTQQGDGRPAEDAEFERKLPENPGDDIAADATSALGEQTPVGTPGPVADNADRKMWLDGLYKKPAKAVSAWVKAAHDAGQDITAEADQYLKDLAARKNAAA
jgi:hypothetical protein